MMFTKLSHYAFAAATCVFCLFVADVVIGRLTPQSAWLSDTASALSLFFCVVCFVIGIVCQEQAAKMS